MAACWKLGERPNLNIRQRALAEADERLALKAEVEVANALASLGLSDNTIEKASDIHSHLVANCPTSRGKKISLKEREAFKTPQYTLVYGEVHFKTYALTFEVIRHKYGGLQKGSGGIFVDLGSGTGKAVFGAFLMHEFDKVVGIELLNGLHNVSLELSSRLDDMKNKKDIKYDHRLLNKNTAIEFLCDDILEVDWWKDADLVFANSTCFSHELMKQISEKAGLMKPGAFFITFTRKIDNSHWKLLEETRHIMSWGEVTVFIQQRKFEDTEEGQSETDRRLS
mmetsp:Transcript_13162/g.15069  ORF Transcript_13162/g.15069 Transcript_13162/m.15069 type:complete len:282 (+) Transcript_13162:173-1018(+)|eukprot:CAMPEP_0184007296 /NCGR_PEP_ID=MMETSP0954-20121128/1243_1 /TAXON_ID=627963 /ORGANISM="Aplanochytrium sp, Strain PBS07" /LENGTH=281 /DNA_ID=CAMNT_0026286087 /DNA_START=1383 /DNA_END=2228 /DNA_ORIENTATION=+